MSFWPVDSPVIETSMFGQTPDKISRLGYESERLIFEHWTMDATNGLTRVDAQTSRDDGTMGDRDDG